MAELDIKKLEELLAAGHREEAKNLLAAYVAQPFTDEEEGEAYVFMAQLYMKLMTQINEEYSEELKTIIKQLEQVDRSEAAANDKIDLGAARKKLS